MVVTGHSCSLHFACAFSLLYKTGSVAALTSGTPGMGRQAAVGVATLREVATLFEKSAGLTRIAGRPRLSLKGEGAAAGQVGILGSSDELPAGMSVEGALAGSSGCQGAAAWSGLVVGLTRA